MMRTARATAIVRTSVGRLLEFARTGASLIDPTQFAEFLSSGVSARTYLCLGSALSSQCVLSTMEQAAPQITPQQRWRVRDTWVFIKPITSSKGFGGFASAKDAVGMPSAVRADHRDWDAKAIEEEAKKQEKRDDALKSLAAIDPEHRLSSTFYGHLFATFPAMQEIFWRFNLFQSLEKIVAVLDPQNDLPKSLRALAERHRGRGILNADYDRIRQSLRYSFQQQICNEFAAADAEAWLTAWDVFAHAMKVPEVAVGAEKKRDAPVGADEGQKAAVPAAPSEREITEEELKKHNTEQDLWVAVEGGIYNLTPFLPEHPGGEMLMLGAGRDATKLFVENFHSDRARSLLPQYRIGRFVSASAAKP